MKPYTYSIFAALFAAGFANAAVTATTTPVGYVSLSIPAASDSTIAPPLENATVFAGASTSISGNVIGATGLTAGAFTTPASYLQVTSGALVGQRFTISANDTSTITVTSTSTLQSLGFASGDTFKVVPFWTFNTLLPQGAGVVVTNDIGNPSSFLLVSSTAPGANKAAAKLYFYAQNDVNSNPDGWYDNDNVYGGPVGDLPLTLGLMYTIRNTGAAATVTLNGTVPNAAPVTPVAVTTGVNDNYLVSPFPINVSLEDSGLASAIQSTNDIGNPIEYVFVFNDTATGYNKAASKLYFYAKNDVNSNPDGWYDNDNVYGGPVDPAVNKVIVAGRGLVLRKAPYGSAGTLKWTTALPYAP